MELLSDWSPNTFPTRPGVELSLRVLEAEGEPRGVVQFNHGAAEHAGRYREFAGQFSGAGFHVYAHDHRGHGGTRVEGAPPHSFGKQGWRGLIDDVAAVHAWLDERHPDLPRLVFGYSMGSVVALEYALSGGAPMDGLVLLGPVLQKVAAMPVLRALLAAERLLKGEGDTSGLFQSLGWDPLNKPFKPARTPFDWLSRDTGEVDAYVADPDCGWAPTTSFAKGMTDGLAATFDDRRFQALDKELPVLLLSGGQDPSTDYGKSVSELSGRLKTAGVPNVSSHVFPDMRHELHNEIGRDDVYARLIDWALETVGQRQR